MGIGFRRGAALLLLSALLALTPLPVSALEEESGASPYVYQYSQWYLSSPHRYEQSGSRVQTWIPATYQLRAGEEEFVAYCCDLATEAVRGHLYRRVNLEDAAYYQNRENQAEGHIRAIAESGYWPDRSDETLQALRAATGIQDLTEGEALAGTQHAIWHYANSSGEEKVTELYTGTVALSSSAAAHQNLLQTEGEFRPDGREVRLYSSSYSFSTSSGRHSDRSLQNIRQVRAYLLGLAPVEQYRESILFSDRYFVDWSYVSADGNHADESYVVTLRFGLAGSPSPTDQLTLTARQGQRLLYQGGLFDSGSETLQYDGQEQAFTLTFATGDLKSCVSLQLSGQQYAARSVYLYLPEGGYQASQTFVGIAQGETPVSASMDVALNGDDTAAQLRLQKHNADGQPVAGCVFALYVRVPSAASGSKELRIGGTYTTDENGSILVQGLNKAYSYFFRELSAPAGYRFDPERKWAPGEDGTVQAENDYELGSLRIEKTVRGENAGQRPFAFAVELDFGSVLLPEAAASFGESACFGPVSFQRGEDGKYRGEVALAAGEGVTLEGIPLGAGYRVTELDPAGEAMESGTAVQLEDGLLCRSLQPSQSGRVSGAEQAAFSNLLFVPGSLSLSGMKYLDGQASVRRFRFSLTEQTDSGAPRLLETVQNDENGVFSFSPIRYTQPGAYVYQVQEQGNGDYLCDRSVYTVTVEVTEDPATGALQVAAPLYRSAEGEAVEQLRFYNQTPQEESETVSVRVQKVWKLDDGGTAADSVWAVLLRNGTAADAQQLSAANGWQYSWTGLDAAFRWTVEEQSVPQGFRSVVSSSGTDFTIVNDDLPQQPEKPVDEPEDPVDPPDDPATTDTPDTPDEPVGPQLPQTGHNWLPVWLLLTGAAVLLAWAWLEKRRNQHEA